MSSPTNFITFCYLISLFLPRQGLATHSLPSSKSWYVPRVIQHYKDKGQTCKGAKFNLCSYAFQPSPGTLNKFIPIQLERLKKIYKEIFFNLPVVNKKTGLVIVTSVSSTRQWSPHHDGCYFAVLLQRNFLVWSMSHDSKIKGVHSQRPRLTLFECHAGLVTVMVGLLRN